MAFLPDRQWRCPSGLIEGYMPMSKSFEGRETEIHHGSRGEKVCECLQLVYQAGMIGDVEKTPVVGFVVCWLSPRAQALSDQSAKSQGRCCWLDVREGSWGPSERSLMRRTQVTVPWSAFVDQVPAAVH